MTADIHTGSPRHGVHGQPAEVDERYAGARPMQRGRLATVDEDHDARLARVAHEPTSQARVTSAPLTWARDSGLLPPVERQPRLRQMLGVCGWAAILGAIGLVVGIRGFIADLMEATPSWYLPAMIAAGAIGIGLTVGAFATVYRRRLPYVLLTAATIALSYATMVTWSVV